MEAAAAARKPERLRRRRAAALRLPCGNTAARVARLVRSRIKCAQQVKRRVPNFLPAAGNRSYCRYEAVRAISNLLVGHNFPFVQDGKLMPLVAPRVRTS